jgi:hypothetical protein
VAGLFAEIGYDRVEGKFTPPTLSSLTSSAAAMPADAMSASAARKVLETTMRIVIGFIPNCPDDAWPRLNGSDLLDCPKARKEVRMSAATCFLDNGACRNLKSMGPSGEHNSYLS